MPESVVMKCFTEFNETVLENFVMNGLNEFSITISEICFIYGLRAFIYTNSMAPVVTVTFTQVHNYTIDRQYYKFCGN